VTSSSILDQALPGTAAPGDSRGRENASEAGACANAVARPRPRTIGEIAREAHSTRICHLPFQATGGTAGISLAVVENGVEAWSAGCGSGQRENFVPALSCGVCRGGSFEWDAGRLRPGKCPDALGVTQTVVDDRFAVIFVSHVLTSQEKSPRRSRRPDQSLTVEMPRAWRPGW
jgi:hypothetical protein